MILTEKKDRIMVVAGACLFQIALLGLLYQAQSSLYAEIRAEYGFPMSRISSFNVVRTLCGALLSGICAYAFFHFSKPLTMAACLILVSLSYAMMSIRPDTWVWFLCPVIMSWIGPISVFPIPYIMKSWFPGKNGFLTGLVMSCSGLGGMVFTPVITRMMEILGWRAATCITGGVMVLTGCLGIYLMFRRPAPQENGTVSPAGIRVDDAPSAQKERFQLQPFLICLAAIFGACAGVQFINYLNMYGQSFGYTLMQGAFAISFVSIGNISGKLLYGLFCDKLGTWWATAINNFCVLVGLLLLVTGIRVYPLFLVGALLLGFANSLCSIAIARCNIAAYGEKRSERYVGYLTGITCAVSAGAHLLFGHVYDSTGHFEPVLIAGTVLVAVSVICSAAQTKSKNIVEGEINTSDR